MVSTWSFVRLEPLVVLFLSLSAWARQNFNSTSILECSLRQFMCDNGRCVQQLWLCDGEDDCGDGSDESVRTCAPVERCKDGEFMCRNKRCISSSWRCDGEQDCHDGSDESEEECAKKECKADHFECRPGVCIPKDWECDGQPDCNNGQDELNCAKTCGTDYLTCNNGNCVPLTHVCDTDDDCGDGSDEIDCPVKTCVKNDFQCEDGSCIASKWRCDGDFDCYDKTDEIDCPRNGTKFSICARKEFQCPDKMTCLHPSWICDGESDCPDGADESPALCSNVTCPYDQFRCTNNYCISGRMECDGKEDCTDGSDEEDCEESVTVCKEDEFHCGDNICIPMKNVCDGKKDCPNKRDEPRGKCGVDECIINNGGCNQLCVDTPTGFYCKCHRGYKLQDNSTCVDVDECENPGACSQTCINEKGTFKCECQEGYEIDPRDRTICKATEGHSLVLFSRRHSIDKVNVYNHQFTTVVSNTKAATAFDFVYKNEIIFWMDSFEKKIFKTSFNSVNQRTEVIKDGIVLSDGLAVDWIYGHIYWTDTGKNTIELANYEGGMRKTLINDSLDEPRSIALNPQDGWMYWSDWGKEGRIERAGLDGSKRQVIVSQDIKWPNGITLDLVKRKLYWVDAKLSSISSVNYDGSGRTLVLRSDNTLHHPFSISVFEDFIYWSDWDKQEIFRANKFTGANVTAVTDSRMLQNPMVVQVFHPYRQPNSDNFCVQSDRKCSHLCLPAPQPTSASSKFTCSCPDGLFLSSDGFSCTNELSIKEVFREESEFTNKTKTVEIIFSDTRPSVPIQNLDTISMVLISAVVVSLISLSSIAFVICRYYFNKNIIHFEHPIYQKAPVEDAAINNFQNQSRKEESTVPLNAGSYDIV